MKTLISILVLFSTSLFAEEHLLYLECSFEKYYNLKMNTVVNFKASGLLTIEFSESDDFVEIQSQGPMQSMQCDDYSGSYTDTHIIAFDLCEEQSIHLEINRMNGKYHVFYYEDEDTMMQGNKTGFHVGYCKKSEQLF